MKFYIIILIYNFFFYQNNIHNTIHFNLLQLKPYFTINFKNTNKIFNILFLLIKFIKNSTKIRNM